MGSTVQSGAAQIQHPDAALETPVQSAAPANSFLLKAKTIKHWLKELPTANVDNTCLQLYETLTAFNRTEIPTLVRAEAIELFRDPVQQVNSKMTTHYVDIGFPLGPTAKKAAQLSYELCAEIALSYKIIIKELLAAGNKKSNQKLLIIAVHRALQYLGLALFQSYLSYSTPKPGVWREIHFLYAWAVQNQVHTIPVKETVKLRWRQKNHSIEDLYKCHVLMSTTSPQRLRQSQISKINDQLIEWSTLTRMMLARDVTNRSGVFFVDLSSDQPPFKSKRAAKINYSRFHAFDLGKLPDTLQDEFDKSSWESPTRIAEPGGLLPRSLLRLLMHDWNKSLERRYARTQLNIELGVVVGLSAIYHLLEQEKQPDMQESTFPETNSSGASIFTNNMEITRPLLDENRAPRRMGQKSFDINDLFSVLTYNESAGGYCISWQSATLPKIRVDDILGIRSDKAPGEYSLGVIRWLKYSLDEKLYLGVQIISPHCASATLMPAAKLSPGLENHTRCLLLNGDTMDKDQLRLISDTREFELNTVLTLARESGTHQIRLTDLVESNSSFIQYQFEYVEDIQPLPGMNSLK